MKKRGFFVLCLFLIAVLSGCDSGENKAESIHQRIHSTYYDIQSYSGECVVTTFGTTQENRFSVAFSHNKANGSHRLESDGIVIEIFDDKTLVSKGSATVETTSKPTDMPFFPEAFFRSYYHSENASLNVSSQKESGSVVLQCEAVNPTGANAFLKLWVDTKTIKPQKMQIFDSKNKMHTQIDYKSFVFDL